MVYILHFNPPLHHAGHYVGYTEDTERRLREHLEKRTGSPLVRAALAAGCEVTVAVVLEGDRELERKIKASKNTGRYCPVCKGECKK